MTGDSSSVGHPSLCLAVRSNLVWREDLLLLQFCPFIPAVSPGAMESSSSPSPLESLPEFVISPIHPVTFVLEWFPDASPSWFAFNAYSAEEGRAVVPAICRLPEPRNRETAGHQRNGGGTPPSQSLLQLELQQPAFQIYGWHLGKQ